MQLQPTLFLYAASCPKAEAAAVTCDLQGGATLIFN